jgi:hypothetical protein
MKIFFQIERRRIQGKKKKATEAQSPVPPIGDGC